MIKFENKINFIDLAYMKKQYGDFYNEKTAINFSIFKFKKLFNNEEPKLVLSYSIYIINKYIEQNYFENTQFLSLLKKLLWRARINLKDLNAQQLLLLEERVFSKNRNIKTLSTNFPIRKNERIGIKFTNAHLFKKLKNRFSLISNGQLLVSNSRIIFITNQKDFLFYWKTITNINYNIGGFTFKYNDEQFTIAIHDNRALNNTIENYLLKISSRIVKK